MRQTEITSFRLLGLTGFSHARSLSDSTLQWMIWISLSYLPLGCLSRGKSQVCKTITEIQEQVAISHHAVQFVEHHWSQRTGIQPKPSLTTTKSRNFSSSVMKSATRNGRISSPGIPWTRAAVTKGSRCQSHRTTGRIGLQESIDRSPNT